MLENDNRTVLTLDAGGTNFVFGAIKGCKEIATPVRLDAVTLDAQKCLETLVEGFKAVKAQLYEQPFAISFAFPGPADYKNGIIGDLPNFPCFRGGVAMGPYLEAEFGIPVHINNDGNLFAYGEALAGALPKVNRLLESSSSRKRYHNLIGITLGTGFGGGVVIEGKLLRGDNGCGGDLWCMRNRKYEGLIAEESVSIRAVKRVYLEYAPEDQRTLEPKDIFDIAEGNLEGNMEAAKKSFAELGTLCADALANALDIVDGLVVIGGGLSGARKYILPALVKELNSSLSMFSGAEFPLVQMKAYNLDDVSELNAFIKDETERVNIPGHQGSVNYEKVRKTGVLCSELGTSKAVQLGAYAFALATKTK